MRKSIKILSVLGLLLLGSCALKPIPSSYAYVKTEDVKLSDLGNGKVLIYNAADWKHTIDKTDRLNLWIDGKEAGQIRAKEYVIYNLDLGTKDFRLVHIDFVKMKSSHMIKIDKSTKVIMVKPTITSNDVREVTVLPIKFNEFKSVYLR